MPASQTNNRFTRFSLLLPPISLQDKSWLWLCTFRTKESWFKVPNVGGKQEDLPLFFSKTVMLHCDRQDLGKALVRYLASVGAQISDLLMVPWAGKMSRHWGHLSGERSVAV